ncbi:unnamed protein product [Sphenostylis stenocarpa]|uniref:Uncharacterized protein n=1 Tax=Sphenostylis stenocarpa TaxID=92480 RepID=A0AA86S175_9FABA|nr:unnamed protein product [Sphenostylis stenocarpa]
MVGDLIIVVKRSRKQNQRNTVRNDNMSVTPPFNASMNDTQAFNGTMKGGPSDLWSLIIEIPSIKVKRAHAGVRKRESEVNIPYHACNRNRILRTMKLAIYKRGHPSVFRAVVGSPYPCAYYFICSSVSTSVKLNVDGNFMPRSDYMGMRGVRWVVEFSLKMDPWIISWQKIIS